MPRSIIQIVERDLAIELAECREHDALDGHDPKELPVLHERDAQAADGIDKKVQGGYAMKGCLTVLILLALLILGVASIPTLMS